MNPTHYPQAALEGFGRALASKLGIGVAYTTGQPRTDGTTIYLPQITTAITAAEFEALCGIAVHEAAHVYFNSVPMHVRFAQGDPRRAACFNAVLDVADETRIEFVFDRARRLLTTSNAEAAAKITSRDLTQADPAWLCLAFGIVANRCNAGRAFQKALPAAVRAPAYQCYRVLRKARTTRLKMKKEQRAQGQWNTLGKLALELIDILKVFPPPPDAPQFGQLGSDAADRAAAGDPVPAGAVLADDSDGEKAAEVLIGDWTDASGSGSSATTGGGAGQSGNQRRTCPAIPMSGPVYGSLRPYMDAVAEAMSRSADQDPEDGYRQGAMLGRDLTRVMNDGRVFARAAEEGELLHLVVLLDSSGSMGSRFGDVAAVAQAMLDAVKPIATTIAAATFGEFVTPRDNFKSIAELENCTMTADALRWAGQRLDGLSGRRVVVVVTDGGPSEPEQAQSECRKLIASGVGVLGIGYRYSASMLQDSMPGAAIATANDPNTLAIRLAQAVEQMAAVCC
jgi:hypothetical protein